MTLDNEAEITHSEYMDDGRVKVYVEKADEKDGFHHLTCYLPSYEITDVYGFDKEEQEKYMEVIRSTAHLIMEFSKDGGFENASGF
jgi:ABC-type microcin C transport system permease subunit YejB